MKNEEILQKTRTFVETCMSGNDPSHDFSHVRRVFDHAVRIADTMTGCNRFYLEMLVLLHDIDDRKLAAAGAHRVDDFLETLPLSPSYRQRISEGVRQISYHAYTQKPQRVDLEVAIARDADWLDAIGAIGVARAFLYSGARGHAIYGGPDETATTLHHFEEKLLGLSRCLFAEHSVHDLSETADVAG